MKFLKNDPVLRRGLAIGAVALYFMVDGLESLLLGEGAGGGAYHAHHLVGILAAALVLWVSWEEIRAARAARDDLARESARRERLSNDLGDHIRQRLAEWRLTAAETDIAWLLIKGFSFAEIAELRGVKEKTLRQQASQIYAKAGVKGRSELSASFMEDLIDGAHPKDSDPPR